MDHRKLTKTEMLLVATFIESLKEEKIEVFWGCISNTNKELIESKVDNLKDHDILEIIKGLKTNFGEYLKDIGMGNIIRFTNQERTKGYLAIQKNIKTRVYYFEGTEVKVSKIPLVLENGDLKIDIFRD